MAPQHLFGWRKAARAGLLTLPADEVPMFVPIVREARDDGVAAAVGVTVSMHESDSSIDDADRCPPG
jgi:transposase